MPELPTTLEQAIAQAGVATQTAIADGYPLLQVELVIPELKPMPIAEQFLPALESFGSQLKVFFPDAGAAALARRDWGEVPFKILDIGTGRVPVQEQIQPEDKAFLLIAPSSVEVNHVEKLCREAGERPVIMLNPRLEDVTIIGVGYAGRQLRERFLNKIESCYYLRPVEGAAVFRCYPYDWQVWLEKGDNDFQLIAELPQKPLGDDLDAIIAKATQTSPSSDQSTPQPKQPGLFTGLQRFLRALSR